MYFLTNDSFSKIATSIPISHLFQPSQFHCLPRIRFSKLSFACHCLCTRSYQNFYQFPSYAFYVLDRRQRKDLELQPRKIRKALSEPLPTGSTRVKPHVRDQLVTAFNPWHSQPDIHRPMIQSSLTFQSPLKRLVEGNARIDHIDECTPCRSKDRRLFCSINNM